MAGIDNGTGALTTSRNEATKTFSVYDVTSHLLTDFYEAPTNAITGTPCLHTEYAYDGASSRIEKSKESMSTWDSSWDI